MPDLTPEQRARQQIDAQLGACGWVVQDYKAVDFSAGRGIALREVPLTTGPCDYLLLVDRKALGVIEAKKVGTTLSDIADQSGRYATSLPDFLTAGQTGTLPFLYESTGVETFFRDERDPSPRSRRVFTFHQPETLADWAAEPDTLRARLKAMPTAHPLATNGMRDCQIEAITGLEQSFAEDRPRALIHMATGAGKTFTACAFTYRLIKYAKAHRVLFLVDRANLGEQARDEFHRYRTPDTGRLFTELYNVQHLTSPHIDDVCRVTICTIQRLYSILRGEETEQALDIYTPDEVLEQGFDAAAKAKAAGLVQAFRDYLAQNQAQIDALQILYSRPFKQRLTEPMLKELEKKLRDTHASWTEDRLWDAFAVTAPGKVRGRSQAGRFADLVALIRFALEQQPVLAPFADSVSERFHEWLMDKAKGGSGVPPLNSDGTKRQDAASTVFTPEQLAWLGLIRDHIATSLSIDPDDFEYTPFGERGGLGKAHQLFGDALPALLEELNTTLAA